MNRSSGRRAHLMARATCIAALGASGLASTPAPCAAAEPQSGALAEIVVTARKREERLQDVPSTIAAMTGEQLADSGARKLSDVSNLTSGVSVVGLGGAQTLVSVRGDSNRIGSTEVGTGVFVDGVFQARPFGLGLGPVDVTRIEFLKGPQSTLYGKNTIAGAINVITNDPTWEPSGEVDVGYGGSSQDGERLWHALGVVSGPVVADRVALRLVVSRSQRDGYVSDPVSGQRGSGYDATDVRLKAWLKPFEGADWRLTASYRDDDAPRMDVVVPGSGTVIGNARPATLQPTFYGSIWRSRTNETLFARTLARSYTSDFSWSTPIGTVSSLTNYQTLKTNFFTDADTTQYGIGATNVREKAKTFSQELRIAGDQGPLNWLAGLFYFDDDVPVTEQSVFWRPDSVNFGAGIGRQYVFFPVSTRTKAVFGQLSYDLTDRLNVTGGLRYAEDDKRGDARLSLYALNGSFLRDVVPLTHRHAEFSGVTGNVVASYKLSPTAMIYGSYGTGTKSGGFGGVSSAGAAVLPFDEAKVEASEVGLKSDLLDRRVHLNLALFNNDYENLQLTQTTLVQGAVTTITTNAAKARAYGADVELSAVLTPELRLNAAYSYLHARIGQYQIAPGVIFTDIAPPRNPTHSGFVGLAYAHQLADGEVRLRGDVTFKSRFNNDINRSAANAPLLAPAKGYHLFNAGVAYGWRNYELGAYVRNIANEEYYIAQVIISPGTYYYGVPGEPRTFEVTLRAEF